MKNPKKIVVGVAAFVIIIAAFLFLNSKIQSTPLQAPLQNSQNVVASSPTSSTNSNFNLVLPDPVVTIYKAGFAKIEIPLQGQTSQSSPFFKTASAAGDSVYTFYRSDNTNQNFVQVATVQDPGNSAKYISVFDTNYPTAATNLSYEYSLSNRGQVSYSGITSETLQQAVDEGIQPWRLDPLWVAEADHLLVSTVSFREPCSGYGSANSGGDESNGTGKLVDESGAVTYCDVYSLISEDASAGIAVAKVVHDGITYTIDLTQPIPGNGKIWMIKQITGEGNE